MFIYSDDWEPEEFFDGWFWHNNDLIVGTEGLSDFQASGGTVAPHLDGCYVLSQVSATDQGPTQQEISVDSMGHQQLYVYRHRSAWAIGTSLYDLAQQVRTRGFTLTPYRPAINSFLVNSGLSQHPVSTATIFKEIALVPTYTTVMIEDGKLRLHRHPRPRPLPYEDALQKFLTLWRSRLLTIIQNPHVAVTIDLSGGLDSRVLFAFLLSVRGTIPGYDAKESPILDPYKVPLLVSNPNAPVDYAVAQDLAKDLGFPLVSPAQAGSFDASKNQRPFSTWTSDGLGTSLSLTPSFGEVDVRIVRGHGAGGECWRQPYSYRAWPAFVVRFTKKFGVAQGAELLSMVVKNLPRPRLGVTPKLGIIDFYRHYRNRFHFGHFPRHRVVFSPLESAAMWEFPARSLGRQALFDMMESLQSGLSSKPFDCAEKSPSFSEQKNITRVPSEASSAGRVFAATDPKAPQVQLVGDATATRKDKEDFFNQLQVALSSQTVRQLLAPDFQQQITELAGAKDLSTWSASRLKPFHPLITLALLLHFAFT